MPSSHPDPDAPTINLKDPALAAFLAWLWPGAGHLYQGRRAKGVLFMVCILGTFFFGFFLGEGRVVYASWKPEPFRWSYLCQVCVGLPALPAMVEAKRARSGRDGLFPNDWFHPPSQVENSEDELDRLQKRLNSRFEFGSIYTMIAGLLNVLAIYDAFGGPAYARSRSEEEEAAEDAPDDAPDEATAKV